MPINIKYFKIPAASWRMLNLILLRAAILSEFSGGVRQDIGSRVWFIYEKHVPVFHRPRPRTASDKVPVKSARAILQINIGLMTRTP